MSNESWAKGIELLPECLADGYQTACFTSTLDKRSLENMGKFVNHDHWLIDFAAVNTVEDSIHQCFIQIDESKRTEELLELLLRNSENSEFAIFDLFITF